MKFSKNKINAGLSLIEINTHLTMPNQHSPPLLDITHLQVAYPSRHGIFHALQDVSMRLYPGEILGIVGESGAGKSTIGNAVAELLAPPGFVEKGEVYLDGQEITRLDSEAKRKIRGKDIGFIFQDPMTSLNPLFTIEDQMVETMMTNLELDKQTATDKAIEWLKMVGIKQAKERIKQYPHQFSGGMRQRVVIAIALSTHPKFIIADEPTTALDVSIQDQILKLIQKLCQQHHVGCLLVTHDMGVVSLVTDRIAVMYQGQLLEIGNTQKVLSNPQHEYTKSLIAAVPRSDKKLKRFPQLNYSIGDEIERKTIDVRTHWLGQSSEKLDYQGPILSVKNINLTFLTEDSLWRKKRRYLQAVDNVSFEVFTGESFGLVGESGSGKSTIARAITGIYPPDSGEIMFAGQSLQVNEKIALSVRRQMQMVFQNPYSSLNPRMRVFDIIVEPIRFHRLAHSEAQIQTIVFDLLNQVGLPKEAARKYPHEFSGGQRQRISIARALAMRPKLLLCDEPTSALDVSVQAQILNLLKDLQDELGLTLLFISHDLPVIRQMCDRIGVMRQGKLVELNDCETLFTNAQHEYTQKLISLMPSFTAH